jgi:uncharacterized membrane protein
MRYASQRDAEAAAELEAERAQDRLDRRYMRGEVDEGEYHKATQDLEQHVRRQVSRHRGR